MTYENPSGGSGRGYSGRPGDDSARPGGLGRRGGQRLPGGYSGRLNGHRGPGASGRLNGQGYPGSPGGLGGRGRGGPGPGSYWGHPGISGGRAYSSAAAYASWAQRAGACLIDISPVIILGIIGRTTGSPGIYFLLVLIALTVLAYNRWFQGGRTGQSWGRMALRLNLIRGESGQPAGAGTAFVRDICHVLDTLACFIGWLFPLWDARRQTLADKIMRTVVVPAA